MSKSLKTNFTYKLISNIINIPLSIIIDMIGMRLLGVSLFGKFNYITEFFNNVTNSIDCGSSTYYYNRISKEPKNLLYPAFYFKVIILISAFIVGIVIGITFLRLNDVIWPKIEVPIIYLGLILGLLTWVSQILQKTLDAHGLSLLAEMSKILSRTTLLSISGLYLLFKGDNIEIFFLLHIITFILLCTIIRNILRQKHLLKSKTSDLPKPLINKYLRETLNYSKPLMTYGLMSMLFLVADRWILQKYFGSQEQGFFGIAVKVSAACLLVTSAMTPLLMRQFAISAHEGNYDKIRMDFTRYLPLFYTISTLLSVFASCHADFITVMFGGLQYTNAISTVQILCLYPIHQSYGQLSGALFYALGNTKQYTIIGVTMMIIGLIIMLIFTLPKSIGGYELGAMGLALKMLLTQIITTNVQLFYNTKILQLKKRFFLYHQLLSIVLFSAIAILTKYLVKNIANHAVVTFLASLSLYMFLSIACIYTMPLLIGFRKKELLKYISKFKKKTTRPQKKSLKP